MTLSAFDASLASLLLAAPPPVLCHDDPAPSLKEAGLVMEVPSWGETVAAVRLEYSDENHCAELTYLTPSHATDSVVRFPSGNFNDSDWIGKFRGALFAHHDALCWSDEDSPRRHPAFVMTVGGPADPRWSTTDFSGRQTQQDHVRIMPRIPADVDVDPARIHAVSLAAGSMPLWSTILQHPGMFAAQISTACDPCHAFKDVKAGHDGFARLLTALPGSFFTGLTDPTGAGVLRPDDTRVKGERLRDIAPLLSTEGFTIDAAYGQEGGLRWNGRLRGESATRLAKRQPARARARKAAHLVTLLTPATLAVTRHWSWDASSSTAGVREWLFRQVNEAPYVSGR